MTPYLKLTAGCDCCRDKVPSDFSRAEFVAGLRSEIAACQANRQWFASDGGMKRYIAKFTAFAHKIERGALVDARDFNVGLSMADRGLAQALRTKGWTKGVPSARSVVVTHDGTGTGKALPYSYDYLDK